jgi:hypothetical protein
MSQARAQSLVSRAPCQPALPCRGALLGVLLRTGQRPQHGGSNALGLRPAALSWRESRKRPVAHRAWLTERKETHDATASDHDP